MNIFQFKKPAASTGPKVEAAELRLKKEVGELDLPSHVKVNFPDDKNLMNFIVNVDLTKEDCLWKGGKY